MNDELAMTDATEQDIEQLELYLDRELPADDVARIDARLTAEPALRTQLDRLRGQRSRRLTAMSFAFDTDASTVERLVASVRTAQASEAIARRRASTGWLRPALTAAACVAFGLGLGVVLHREHGSASGTSGSAITAGFGPDLSTGDTNVSFKPQGAYIVSLRDREGNVVARVQFPTQQQAQSFIDQANRAIAGGSQPINAGEAKVVERPY